jgi:hypothetical protein
MATLLRAHDDLLWRCVTRHERFRLPDLDPETLHDVVAQGAGWQQAAMLRALGVEPAVEVVEGNLLMYGGASCLWQWAIGNGTTTAGQATTYVSNARAAIGVGDSTTAAVATHTDLQAATNKLRVGMDPSFPTHTDGTASGSASATWQATFSTSQGNYAWQEWALFNSSTAATGRMIQRKVQSQGTKPNNEVWTIAVTLSLS